MAKKHVPDVPLDKRYLATHERNDKSVDCPSKRTYVDEDIGSEPQETDEVTCMASIISRVFYVKVSGQVLQPY